MHTDPAFNESDGIHNSGYILSINHLNGLQFKRCLSSFRADTSPKLPNLLSILS